MLSESVKRVVEVLSEVYGFKVEEAYRMLEKPKGECVVPFMEKVEGWCDGLKMNHGLYTQCNKKPVKGETLCKTCAKHGGKHGLASEREREGEKWRDAKGKVPAHFGNVMEKLKLEKEAVKVSMMRIYKMKASDIPEELFEKKKTTRGRPKKVEVVTKEEVPAEKGCGRGSCPPTTKEVDVIPAEKGCGGNATGVTRTKGVDDVPAKKRRGRPKKENKEVVAEVATGGDLIESLINEAKKSADNQEEVGTKKPREKKTKKQAEEETKKEVVPVEEDEGPSTINMETEMEVELVTIDGVEYMVDEDQVVYDATTQEPIGKFDGEKIELCEFEYED